MYVCGIVGLMVIGAMVASMVGITTPIAFESAGLVLQDIVDSILPCAIDLAVVMAMYAMIKKRFKTGWLLAICIVGGIVINGFIIRHVADDTGHIFVPRQFACPLPPVARYDLIGRTI